MSDIDEKEERRQEVLAKVYKDYLITVICCCVGWTGYQSIAASTGGDMDGGAGGVIKLLLMLISLWIIIGPVFMKIMKSSVAGAFFFWQDYEVITTYSDGTKTSDGGAESMGAGIFMFGFKLVAALFLSLIITVIKLIYLPIRTIICYLMVRQKPNFLFSPFPVLIVSLAVFFGAAIIPQKIAAAAEHAANVKAYKAYSTAQDLSPQEARAFIAEAAKNFLAKDHDDTRKIDERTHISFEYHAADGAGRVLVEEYRGKKSAYPTGTYYFSGTNFTKFEDTDNTGEQPSQSDIEAVKKYLPVFFVTILDQVKDSDLYAKKWVYSTGYTFGIRGLDYNERTTMSIDRSSDKWRFNASVLGGVSLYGGSDMY
jgi:hypothetical protein